MTDKTDEDLQIVSYVPINQVVFELGSQLTEDQMVQFVKDLDLEFATWDVTEALYKYFKKQHKILKKELTRD